jgi:hypothetical protein
MTATAEPGSANGANPGRAGAGGGYRALGSWSMDWFHERAIFKAFQELARRLAGGKAS